MQFFKTQNQIVLSDEKLRLLSCLDEIYEIIYQANINASTNRQEKPSDIPSSCPIGVECMECSEDSLFCITDETFGLVGFLFVLVVYCLYAIRLGKFLLNPYGTAISRPAMKNGVRSVRPSKLSSDEKTLDEPKNIRLTASQYISLTKARQIKSQTVRFNPNYRWMLKIFFLFST